MDLPARIAFLLELDKAKTVIRACRIADGSRRENDAEHMWHFAMAALVLAPPNVDRWRVVLMALVHDIVEIDAGDTIIYAHDPDKADREARAADRLYGLLDEPLASQLRDAWEEFELGQSPESRFARSLDRLLPLLLNHASKGVAWQEHGITADRVREINSRIGDGSPQLWAYAQTVIDDAVAQGFLAEK